MSALVPDQISLIKDVVTMVGVGVALLTWTVSVFNASKTVLWKRAELANQQLKELSTNAELVFASRALDWTGGRLVVPDTLRALLPDGAGSIVHEPEVLHLAMRADLLVSEADADPRLLVYRTAIDTLLTWLGLVDSALERALFKVEDVRDVGFWVLIIERSDFMQDFIKQFGYEKTIDSLARQFRQIGVTNPDCY